MRSWPRYREKFANPYKAAELGFIDEVIAPRTVRRRLAAGLDLLGDKRQKTLPKEARQHPSVRASRWAESR